MDMVDYNRFATSVFEGKVARNGGFAKLRRMCA